MGIISEAGQYRIGIDLGGSKIETVLIQGSRVCWRKRLSTPTGDYSATLQVIEQSLRLLTNEFSIAVNLPVGIGTPGTLDSQGNIKNANSTCLN